jgi:hypothetical protein
MVLNIAAGQKLEDELGSFMFIMSILLDTVDAKSMEPHWFIGGMVAMVQLFMSNLFVY